MVAAAVGAVTAIALGIAVAGGSAPTTVDAWVLATFQDWAPDAYATGLVLDFLGEPRGVLILCLLVSLTCLGLGRWRLALVAVLAQGALGLVTTLVKPVVDREIHGGFLSYPSGHTAGTAAFALVVGLLVADLAGRGRASGVVIVLGCTVIGGIGAAWAQTYLVAHYASDTVGGLALTLAVVPPLAFGVDLVVDRAVAALRRRRAPGGPDV